MKRRRATELLELVLRQAANTEWPNSLVESVYVYGSYARGALEPGDVDVAIGLARDHRWTQHRVNAFFDGHDPYSLLSLALRGRRRGVQFSFNPAEMLRAAQAGLTHAELMLLWRRGESIELALQRLHSIAEDPSAGRAPRQAMRPVFEGLDHWVGLAMRESLGELLDAGAITIEQIVLLDAEIAEIGDPVRQALVRDRWAKSSPLRRAAVAALAHLRRRGVDVRLDVRLQGERFHHSAPYLVELGASRAGRYLDEPEALTFLFDGGVEELLVVVHPTRAQPLAALQIKPDRRSGSHEHR